MASHPVSASISSSRPAFPCSLPNPEHAWAAGNPKILSDDDVDRWLGQHAPETAAEIKREKRQVENQIRSEFQFGLTSDNSRTDENFANMGKPLAEISKDASHWAYHLFPGCGGEEICEIVKPVLNAQRHKTLYMALAQGLDHKDIASHFNCTRAAITLRLSKIRRILFKMAEAGKLPCPHSVPVCETSAEAVIAETFDPKLNTHFSAHGHRWNGYAKKPTTAYVCSCGRHLGVRHLDHRRIAAGRERSLHCDYCGIVYKQADWSALTT